MSRATLTGAVAAAWLDTWRAILADKAVLIVLFAAGLLYSVVYPYPYSREAVRRAPIAVVDADRGSLSRQLTRFVAASPQLDVVAVLPGLPEAQDLLWRGRIVGVLVLPRGLQADVLAGRVARVEVAGNGAYFLLNKAVLGSVAQAVGTVSAGIEIKRLEAGAASPGQAAVQREAVTLRSVALYNLREGYGSAVVPAVGVLIVQQTALIAIALLVGSGRQAGRRPLHPTAAGFVGAWLAFASAVVLNGLYWFGWVAVWQDLPRAGQLAPLLAFLGLFALAVSAFGLAVGSFFRSREGGMQVMLFVSVPMLFLAGTSWPDASLPALLQALKWTLPSTAGIPGFVALNQMGASGAEIAGDALALAALGAVSFVLGLWRWLLVGRRDVDQSRSRPARPVISR
jgi:ABC-2 type transport system permease protein